MDTKLTAAKQSMARADGVDWNAVYRELLPRVYRYFCYRLGEGPLAEDLTSATFEKAWRSRLRYRRDLSAFPTWVLTIARNVATDHFRTANAPLGLETALLADEKTRTPEEWISAEDDFERLRLLVAQLADREQELLALRYGAELTQREIANITGLTQSNVGVILHRSVGKLRDAWEESDGG
jgi:RNA polymerase sigma-70 factor, ECF subfamily